jgi:hypothetical protein
MRGAVPPLGHMFSWRAKINLTSTIPSLLSCNRLAPGQTAFNAALGNPLSTAVCTATEKSNILNFEANCSPKSLCITKRIYV